MRNYGLLCRLFSGPGTSHVVAVSGLTRPMLCMAWSRASFGAKPLEESGSLACGARVGDATARHGMLSQGHCSSGTNR